MGTHSYTRRDFVKVVGVGVASLGIPNWLMANEFSQRRPNFVFILIDDNSPRHGVITVGSSERGPAHLRRLIPVANKTTLDSEIVTIAEALKPAGYVSASMGKWHLGND
jgi:hypothetical protein